jgi:hypothetical protein
MFISKGFIISAGQIKNNKFTDSLIHNDIAFSFFYNYIKSNYDKKISDEQYDWAIKLYWNSYYYSVLLSSWLLLIYTDSV